VTTVETLVRSSGLVLCAGGVLSAAATAAQPFVDVTTANPAMTAAGTVAITGGLLTLLGMPAWYAVQAARAGRLGAAGFVMTFLGWAGLQVATQPFYTYVAPALYARPGNADLAEPGALDEITTGFLSYVGVTLILLNLGLVLFGVAMIRARAFPRALGYVIALGPLGAFVPPIEAGAITATLLALATCGLLLATGRVTAPASGSAAPVPAG